MQIIFNKTFKKKLKKRSHEDHTQLKNRLDIFINDPSNIVLNNHALHGIYSNCRSININGDLRAIYKLETEDIALFVDIDTHSNLYR